MRGWRDTLPASLRPVEEFFLKIFRWAEETASFLSREWSLRWQLYALLGGFFLLLLFMKYVYLPRRVGGLALRGGAARGGKKEATGPALLTCPRCRNTFPQNPQAAESFCPYCGTPVSTPSWAEP